MARGKAADRNHLRQRGNVWFVQKRLSPVLAQHLGKKMLQQSTQTGDLDAACRVRNRLLVELAELEASLLGRASPAQQRREFLTARDRFREAELSISPYDEEVLTLSEVMDPEKLSPIEQDAFRAMHSDDIPSAYQLQLKGALEDWLRSPRIDRKYSTRSKNARSVEVFLESIERKDIAVRDITRKQVRTFVEAQMVEGKTKQTIANYLSGLSAIWRHARKEMDEVSLTDNPFKDHSLNPKATVRNYDRFTRADVEAIFQHTEELQGIWYLLPRLGFYSGARLDELCSLTTKDIIQDQGVWCFAVRKGKNDNAKREVPLHSEIETLVLNQLKYAQEIGSHYLFPEVAATERADGKKGPKFSQWFSRLTDRIISKEGRKIGFHSFRSTAITTMMGAGHLEQLVVWIVGHERGRSSSAKTYNHGPHQSLRLQAVEAIRIEALP